MCGGGEGWEKGGLMREVWRGNEGEGRGEYASLTLGGMDATERSRFTTNGSIMMILTKINTVTRTD